MLSGTAPVDAFTAHAPTLADFGTAPADLGGVRLLKVVAEIAVAGRTSTLPPGLHPTNPPTAIVHVWQVASSPWGPFAMGEVRIGSRSGTRPRGFVVACVVDGPDAAAALRWGWGFPARPGEVHLGVEPDEARAEVRLEGELVVGVAAGPPVPLEPGDIAWTTTLTLAHTPLGDRLLQVEVDHRPGRAERRRAELTRLEGSALGHPALVPTIVVSASLSEGDATLPALRFVARPDEPAFGPTERVGGDAGA